jgi:hypothetical protein
MPTDMTPEALDDAIAACRAPMLAILKDASFGSISAQRQKQNIERFDAAITALRARLAEVEAQLATARAALESAQESIAAFMGVHNYPIDSGAGDVLQQVSAALALIDQPAAPQPLRERYADHRRKVDELIADIAKSDPKMAQSARAILGYTAPPQPTPEAVARATLKWTAGILVESAKMDSDPQPIMDAADAIHAAASDPATISAIIAKAEGRE